MPSCGKSFTSYYQDANVSKWIVLSATTAILGAGISAFPPDHFGRKRKEYKHSGKLLWHFIYGPVFVTFDVGKDS